MKIFFRAMASFCLIVFPLLLQAQTILIKKGGDDAVKIKAGGRFYYDGVVLFEDETKLGNGTSITDIHLGIKVEYKSWKSTIDMALAQGKVSARDVFIQYNLNNKSYLRGGHFAEPFGLDRMEGSSGIKFMTPNSSSQCFAPGRNLGVEYIIWGKNYWFGAGLFGDGNAMSGKSEGNDGYAGTARFAYAPIQSPGKLLHFGLAGSLRKPDANGYESSQKEKSRNFAYKSNLLNKIDKRYGIINEVSDTEHQAKFAVELLASCGPVLLQGEYFSSHISFKDNKHNYKTSGAYAQVGVLAIGGDYKYSSSWGRFGSPSPKSLEFLLRYNYTDIGPSMVSDVSFAANYYLNKYIVCRLNYSNIKLMKAPGFMPKERINLIQARLQVIF